MRLCCHLVGSRSLIAVCGCVLAGSAPECVPVPAAAAAARLSDGAAAGVCGAAAGHARAGGLGESAAGHHAHQGGHVPHPGGQAAFCLFDVFIN